MHSKAGKRVQYTMLIMLFVFQAPFQAYWLEGPVGGLIPTISEATAGYSSVLL